MSIYNLSDSYFKAINGRTNYKNNDYSRLTTGRELRKWHFCQRHKFRCNIQFDLVSLRHQTKKSIDIRKHRIFGSVTFNRTISESDLEPTKASFVKYFLARMIRQDMTGLSNFTNLFTLGNRRLSGTFRSAIFKTCSQNLHLALPNLCLNLSNGSFSNNPSYGAPRRKVF